MTPNPSSDCSQDPIATLSLYPLLNPHNSYNKLPVPSPSPKAFSKLVAMSSTVINYNNLPHLTLTLALQDLLQNGNVTTAVNTQLSRICDLSPSNNSPN